MSSSDVKDKGDLMAGRKSIEREMERFKLCEKEMKTKAFSKEGLGAAAKLDPREQARAEIREWLNMTVDTLNQQVSGGGNRQTSAAIAPCLLGPRRPGPLPSQKFSCICRAWVLWFRQPQT